MKKMDGVKERNLIFFVMGPSPLVAIMIVLVTIFGAVHTLRGNRWAYLQWDFPGLQTFVHIDGVLNDFTQVSKGWTALIVLPWSGMKELAGHRALPPKEGDIWRFFLGRYETLSMNGEKVSVGWASIQLQ